MARAGLLGILERENLSNLNHTANSRTAKGLFSDRLATNHQTMTSRITLFCSGSGTTASLLLTMLGDASENTIAIKTIVTDSMDCVRKLKGIFRGKVYFLPHPGGVSEDWGEAAISLLSNERVDFYVLLGFQRLIPGNLLSWARQKFIGTHPSLLPSYPGPLAVTRALRDGHDLIGVTLFEIDEGIDSGPIISQTSLKVDRAEEFEVLFSRIRKRKFHCW